MERDGEGWRRGKGCQGDPPFHRPSVATVRSSPLVSFRSPSVGSFAAFGRSLRSSSVGSAVVRRPVAHSLRAAAVSAQMFGALAAWLWGVYPGILLLATGLDCACTYGAAYADATQPLEGSRA